MKNKILLSIPLILLGLSPFSNASEIEWGGEIRLRPEYRGNPDFNNQTEEANSFVGSRLRITGSGKASDEATIKVTLQDSRLWGEEPGTATGFTDSGEAVDIHEGYVEFTHFLNLPFNFRAGRQELVYGESRLIGPLGWSHQARAFDAFRLFLDNPNMALDLFTAKRKENNGTSAANPSLDRDFSGIYSTWKKIIPNATADLYFLHDREGDTTSIAKAKSIFTIGARANGKIKSFDYSLETPFQFGDNGTVVGVSSSDVKINAHALTSKLGYTFSGDKQVRIGVEYDFASGDNDATDNKAKTFNNLYPTNHMFYGYMDNQGWRNMEAWNLSLSVKPKPTLFASLNLWDFSLAEKKDGWYNASGSATGSLRSASASNTKSNIGNEIDLLLRYTASPQIFWEFGYGHFFSGDLIKDRIQDEGDSDWAYIMNTVKF